MKVIKEWTIPAPWGKIALISFGNPDGDRILLVHGRQDSATTFVPLLERLPEKYYYVAIDMPGNGKSDPFPNGVKVQRFHFLGALELVLEYLGWRGFTYMAHSMGCEHGLFYNAIYPGRVGRFVLLDVIPTLQRLQVHDPVEYQAMFYNDYYENYHKDNFQIKPYPTPGGVGFQSTLIRLITDIHTERLPSALRDPTGGTIGNQWLYDKSDAIKAVMKARGLTQAQAELILSRNLIPAGGGKYRLSWDRRLKLPAPQNYPNEYYYELFKGCPPTLVVSASEGSGTYVKGYSGAKWLVSELERNLDYFRVVEVEGNHDVHFIHPEKVARYVKSFLEGNREKSKL